MDILNQFQPGYLFQNNLRTNVTSVLITCVFSFVFSLQLSAYSYLYVEDPQRFDGDLGTIDHAEFTFHPRGAYIEVGMYLTLSAGNSYLTEQMNLLEIVMGFDLPDDAMVIDSWLWINGEIVRADIRDRWTASTIYEEIVGRQQDPSILYKNSENQYELRIYPLEADSYRRVKITYLVPAQWNQDHISVALPTELLNQSSIPLDNIQIQIFEDNTFDFARFSDLDNIEIEESFHASLGSHERALIQNEQFVDGLDISFSSPLVNGVYLQQYEGEEENYYQLVLQPTELLSLRNNESNRLAVLVDYDINNSSLSKEVLLQTIEDQLISQLTDVDYFNVFISETDISPVSDGWIPATDANIKQYFRDLEGENISNFSNLPDLLTKGINYIKQEKSGGSVFLISSASQVGEPEIANIFIQDLDALLGDNHIPIYISDYQTENLNYFWLNDLSYVGNEYFYNNIAKLTEGSVSTIREHNSIKNTILNSYSDLKAIQGILDLHTTLKDGFCYGRYNLNSDEIFSINKPYIQIGKYQGSFPFEIEAAGVIQGDLFNQSVSIVKPDIDEGEIFLQTIWAGNYIQSLENYNNTNAEVSDIIKWSLENRVLSRYTAFLALEVEQGGVVCGSCIDETDLGQEVFVDPIVGTPEGTITFIPGDFSGNEDITATSDILIDSQVSITGSPNPFSDRITFQIQLSSEIRESEFIVTIYDLNGILIKTFRADEISDEDGVEIVWDGTDNQGQFISAGMYILNLKSPLGQKNFKLIYIN